MLRHCPAELAQLGICIEAYRSFGRAACAAVGMAVRLIPERDEYVSGQHRDFYLCVEGGCHPVQVLLDADARGSAPIERGAIVEKECAQVFQLFVRGVLASFCIVVIVAISIVREIYYLCVAALFVEAVDAAK